MAFRRQSTIPMDFEYDNKQGPVDAQSPFMNIANNTAKKRPHSVLDSPSKNAFATPDRPHLREPQSQHYLFSQTKPLPAVPSRIQNPSLWEPRTPQSTVDFSSGGETPNTLHEDSEATPDTGLRNRMSRMLTNTSNDSGRTSPKKSSRRESFFGSLFTRSPGKGDSRSSHYSSKAENRVMKRRKQKALSRQADDLESDNDDDSNKGRRSRKKGSKKGEKDAQTDAAAPSEAPSSAVEKFFSFIDTHPRLPHILSWYAQLLLNLFIAFGAMYVMYSVWHAVTSEVDIHAHKKEMEMLHESATCAKSYRENKCDPETRVPAMENVCNNWYECMQRDPKKVARASVTAKTWALIFNSFIEEFSYKSMIFTAIMIFGGFQLSNWTFDFFRSKHTPVPQHDPYVYAPPPATPQRYPSGGFIDQQGYYTPYPQNQGMQALEPLQSQATGGGGGGDASPVKKLIFR
ncbi:hypothetical protein GQ43DRAFT_460306 [Delitschia confertaspora ATCC 74209]|uniref:Brl1/Brr6 domain-containing protein n=1 Tax=Delitschia confertaspora ATCC 74209 TaxID=1513339 RepID=A0A9P4MZ72_9PLEO|nr:hypothetical protein GQ43DRAFT_460306 [Delitschia confertaspora ATCC 74209]